MKYLSALALAAISAPAYAQVAGGPENFVAFVTQVATNVYQGRMTLVWDRASQALKGNTPKDRFVAQSLAQAAAARLRATGKAWSARASLAVGGNW